MKVFPAISRALDRGLERLGRRLGLEWRDEVPVDVVAPKSIAPVANGETFWRYVDRAERRHQIPLGFDLWKATATQDDDNIWRTVADDTSRNVDRMLSGSGGVQR